MAEPHLKQSWIHIVAIVLAGIGVLDLVTGDTDKPILPSFIGNFLNQQIDIVLIIIAAIMLLFVS